MRSFWLLTREALGDAFRRRIVGGVAIAALLSIAMLESCTGCTPSIHVNGEVRELAELRGAFGFTTFLVLGLWSIALAGVLASDHLRAALDDGSATLSLARPISRDTFALARLAGVMGVTVGAGGLVLGAAALLLASRSGLPIAPAVVAAGACLLGALTVAALAMAASLALPRVATVLLVLGGIGLVALANGVAPFAENAGWLGAIDAFGPPLASTLALALAPWLEALRIPGDGVRITARLVAWAIGATLALVFAFRRVELGR
jgi:ABC-type transport system involved in multi-copper enzyme maturation permease subunit